MPRVLQRSRGTGPRATGKKRHFTVGRGPVPRHRRCTPTFAGDRPPRYGPQPGRFFLSLVCDRLIANGRAPHSTRPFYRRARALGCHTRIRAGFPRHRRCTPTFAGDRPPRYGPQPGRFFLSLVCDRLIANGRMPHSTRPTVNGTLFFPVARGPVPRECSTRAKNARRPTPFSVPIEARRGTGPRPTVKRRRPCIP